MFSSKITIEGNFRDWLVYVLSHIHDYDNDNDYSKDMAILLPNNRAQKKLLRIPYCLWMFSEFYGLLSEKLWESELLYGVRRMLTLLIMHLTVFYLFNQLHPCFSFLDAIACLYSDSRSLGPEVSKNRYEQRVAQYYASLLLLLQHSWLIECRF